MNTGIDHSSEKLTDNVSGGVVIGHWNKASGTGNLDMMGVVVLEDLWALHNLDM